MSSDEQDPNDFVDEHKKHRHNNPEVKDGYVWLRCYDCKIQMYTSVEK